MASGGARAHSGPPPDPQALRRDRDATEWTRLPARRLGDPPTWPLARPTVREKTLWARLWSKPQAVMWEAFEMFDQVAMYVRALVAAEKREASVAARTLLLRQEDALGLSTAGLRVNRWIIAAEDLPTNDGDDQPEPRRTPRGGTARTRLLGVIDGGA